MFITTSMVDHDEEQKREPNLIVHSAKSEAEVTNNRRVPLLTDTKHRAASLRQQSYLYH